MARLILNHVYKLSFFIRSDTAVDVNIKVQDSTLTTTSLNQTLYVPPNIWTSKGYEFTCLASDDVSKVLFILPGTALVNVWFDKIKLIDLTLHRKQYRIMRIQGSMMPGSFIQTLTLREKTAAETG